MALSQKAQEVEAQNEAAAQEKESAELNDATKVYWHQAEIGQLANFQEEVWMNGRVRPERPLRFSEHTYQTTDQKEIEFIEGSDSFRKNTIQFCGFGDEGRRVARAKTAELISRKTVRTHECSIVETSPTVTDMVDAPTDVGQAPVQ